MHISVSLLFLCIGSTFAKKEGDFGIFTACIDKKNNNTLRLQCYYPDCQGSIQKHYTCEFLTVDRRTLTKTSDMMCKNFNVPSMFHDPDNATTVTNFTCILTRIKRKEEKNITIDYRIRKGKFSIVACQASAPSSVWPMVILSLWRVLDSQLT